MKLFQLLVRETELKNMAEKIKAETKKVFCSSKHLEGLTRTYRPKDAAGDPLPDERKEIVTTASERLAWTWKALIPFFDYEIQRDKTNQTASADLVVGGVTLAKNVPATLLLSLEKQLRNLRDLYDVTPTLDMAKAWKRELEGGERWVHGPTEQYRFTKKTVPVILYEATERHPAQVKEVTEDVMIGTFTNTETSGALHPQEKANLLARVDILIEAVITARMKANETPAVEDKIGEALYKFIHAPK